MKNKTSENHRELIRQASKIVSHEWNSQAIFVAPNKYFKQSLGTSEQMFRSQIRLVISRSARAMSRNIFYKRINEMKATFYLSLSLLLASLNSKTIAN